MSEKKIKTKEQKKLIIYDIAFFIFLNIFTYLVYKKTIIGFINECMSHNEAGNFFSTCYCFIYGILSFIAVTIIFIIIYLAFRITKMKSIKQNTTYKETYGIEYYRDKLPSLSATEISLITDLNIENKKDISASLLNLYQKNIVSFKNNKILVNETNLQNLRQSDKKLLEIVTSQKIAEQNIKEWKKICIQEAIQDGYIQNARKDRYSYLNGINKVLKNSFKVWGITFILLMIIIGFKMSADFPNMTSKFYDEQFNTSYSEPTENNINENLSEEIDDDTDKELVELMNNPLFLLLLVIHSLSIPAIFYAIIYRKSKMVIVKSNESLQNNYERTEKGNELAEKIVGLKKYINEFSMLSEREKEEVVLWEDFLTYAVLLEENEKIIKDIFSYKNINISILDNLENISTSFKNVLGNLNASQLFDENYTMNRVAHIFCKILTEDLLETKIEEYYYLWYHFSKFNQQDKEILKNDINNILFESNNTNIMEKYDEIYQEIKLNKNLRNSWQKYITKLAGTNPKLLAITYEDLYRSINYIAKLVS